MNPVIEFLMGLSVEYAGSISIAIALAAWKLRTPDARAELRAWLACRLAAALALFREILPVVRCPWMWPMFLAIPVGIGLDGTRWGGTVEAAGGALATVYLCAAVLYIARGRLR